MYLLPVYANIGPLRDPSKVTAACTVLCHNIANKGSVKEGIKPQVLVTSNSWTVLQSSLNLYNIPITGKAFLFFTVHSLVCVGIF